MTPFSFIFIIIYLFIFFTGKDIKTIIVKCLVMTLFTTVSLNMGYFYSNGSSQINYSVISWLMSSFLIFIQLAKSHKNDKGMRKAIWFFFFTIFLSSIYFYLNRYDKPIEWDFENVVKGESYGESKLTDTSLKFGYIYISIMFCLTIFALKNYLDRSEIIKISYLFVKVSYLPVFVAAIEFFFENIFGSIAITEMTVAVFGEAPGQQLGLNERDGLSAMQGLTREASMFSVSLLYSSLISISVYLQKRSKICKLYCYICLIMLLINRSMSSNIYFFVLVALMAYFNFWNTSILSDQRKVKYYIYIGILSSFFLLFIASFADSAYFLMRLNTSLNEFSGFADGSFSSSSEGARFLGIYQAINVVYDRPLLGIGVGCIPCLSGIISIAASIGVLGLVAYLYLYKQLLVKANVDIFFLILFVVIIPNLLLNDLITMFSLGIPMAIYSLGDSIIRNNRTFISSTL